MMFFRNIRPRRFNHTFIYIDERREMLRDIERRAAEVLSSEEDGKAVGKHVTVRPYAGDRDTRRSGQYRRQSLSGLVLLLLFIVILFIALISIFINF